jgi:tryptophanyl-tRNA synthetase
MGEATRVMSLKDGTKKMSKSDESDLSRINMTDDADTIVKKIKKAQTDADPMPDHVDGLDGRPGASNLVTIYAALSETTRADVVAKYAGQGWGVFKPALADLAVEKLAPMTARMNALMADKAEIDRILTAGSDKAGEIAAKVVQDTRDIMGFWK